MGSKRRLCRTTNGRIAWSDKACRTCNCWAASPLSLSIFLAKKIILKENYLFVLPKRCLALCFTTDSKEAVCPEHYISRSHKLCPNGLLFKIGHTAWPDIDVAPGLLLLCTVLHKMEGVLKLRIKRFLVLCLFNI